jgi:hypothetical protein
MDPRQTPTPIMSLILQMGKGLIRWDYSTIPMSFMLRGCVTKWRCRDPMEFSSLPIFYSIRNNRPS